MESIICIILNKEPLKWFLTLGWDQLISVIELNYHEDNIDVLHYKLI